MKIFKSGCAIVGGIVLLLIGVAIIAAINSGGSRPASVSTQDKPQVELTMEKYNKLEPGMTPEQVEQVLGTPGTEQSSSSVSAGAVSSTSTLRTYSGSGFMAGTISVVYSNGRLMSKSQFGLK